MLCWEKSSTFCVQSIDIDPIKGSKENIDVSKLNQLGTVTIGRNEEIIDCTTLGDEPVIHANSKEDNRILKRVFGRD
jgi:hypothetical protein